MIKKIGTAEVGKYTYVVSTDTCVIYAASMAEALSLYLEQHDEPNSIRQLSENE